ncbi:hypothetical protein NKG94_36790 [Micromonospora sp. M12]
MAELNQGISHLMQAANHAAMGAGATVGPRVQVARSYVAPTAAKVRDRASTGWGRLSPRWHRWRRQPVTAPRRPGR